MAFKIGLAPQGAPPQQGPESWKDYFVRNIGATAESYAAIPDVIKTLVGDNEGEPSQRGNPIDIEKENTQRQQAGFAPTTSQQLQTQQAPQEQLNFRGQFLNAIGKPEGFGESRNLGESALRFGLGELPFAYGAGALKSIPTLGRHALGAATSFLGAKGGQKLAEVGGLGERGQLASALVGGIAAPVGVNLLKNPLSKALKPFELKKQEKAFNINKNEQLGKVKSTYDSALADIEASKGSNIKNVESGIEAYKKSIEDLKVQQKNAYAEAKKFENAKIDTTSIKDIIHEVDQSLDKGVIRPQRAVVRDVLDQLQQVKTLKDAKQFKQTLNGEAYNRTLAPAVKKSYQRINEKLADVISKAETAHEVPFRQGEQTTVKIKELQKGEREFLKQQNKEKSIIEAEARKTKAEATKEFKKEHGDISENTFQKQQLFEKKQERIEQSLLAVPNDVKSAASDLTFAAIGWGLGGYKGSILAKLSKNIATKLASEAAEVTRLVREHPELKQEILKMVASGTKRDAPAFANRFLRTDGLFKKYEQESKPKQRFVIGTAPSSP